MRSPSRPPFARRTLVLACLLGLAPAARAATFAVSTEAELRQAILDLNASSGAHFLDVRADIALTQSLPPITNTVTLRGNGFQLDGQGQYQLLVLGDPAGTGPRILVQVSNLTLANGLAAGGDGSSGGGGGLGAGGALLVNSRADVLLSNVDVQDSLALGGDGAAGLGGSGGLLNGVAGGSYGSGGASNAAGSGGGGGWGGGGGSGSTGGGSGGMAGGAGGTTEGGGGAGLGGGIFVADGGSLSLGGNSAVLGNAAAGGSGGGGDGAAGTGAGEGMFLGGSGNLALRVSAGQSLVLKDNISDSVGSGLLPASSYAQWNVLVAGGGPQPIDPGDPAAGALYGQVILDGTNRFAGNLYVNGADVVVNSLDALGVSGGVVALNDGGLYLADGLTLSRDLAVDNGGGRIGITSGEAVLANDISGTGTMEKMGAGDLVLAGTSSHDGDWRVKAGNLVLDSDARLGNAALSLYGGGLRFAAAFNDLRSIELGLNGSIDNGGFDVTLTGITGWSGDEAMRKTLVFEGSGTTTLAGAQAGTGDTRITEGTVVGAIATGNLSVMTGATYSLGGANRSVGLLTGGGEVLLGGRTLALALKGGEDAPTGTFSGRISGSGGLAVGPAGAPGIFDPLADFTKFGVQTLGIGNTYTGGTTVYSGAVLQLTDSSSVGSGPLRLAGGVLRILQSSSSLNIQLQGGGGLVGNLQLDGVVSGTGTLVKYGAGTLTLANANTYVGNTLVVGEGAYLALAHPDALGSGTLQLAEGGGLRLLTDTASLRPIQILDGVGVVDVGGYDAQSLGGITGGGTSSLRKEGSGRLLLNGALTLARGVDIAAGVLQVGNGGSSGAISGDISIAGGAELVIDRGGALTLGSSISGGGSVLASGTGTVILAPAEANTFLGGLTVRNGLVAAGSERALGFGSVLLDDFGGLQLLGDIGRSVDIGSVGGRLDVAGSSSFVLGGDVLQAGGLLAKTGTGTLVLAGIAGEGGATRVVEGTLQIGSGLRGNLAGDVLVDAGATLVFGRDDLVQYSHVIDGDGTVIKRGDGDLVLTADQLFTGTFQVEDGNLRVGLGGSSGSLNGDVDLAAGTRLLFDRGDASVYSGGTSGAGAVQKIGPGLLTVLGDLGHGGGTTVTSGELAIGDGGSAGSIAGDVSLALGTRLVVNRGDDVVLAANLSGTGLLVQRGSGSTVLAGSNTQSGGVIIEAGRLGVDSDARLGGGDLIMEGGLLRYEAAFDDLRALRLRSGGGGLDTNGFDVGYGEQVSGNGLFTKAGAGRLTVTSLLGVNVQVDAGELRIGDGASAGLLTGSATVAAGATLAFARADLVSLGAGLGGSGNLRQLGSGELRLPGNYAAFAGHTWVDNGSLRLDGTLGGDLTLADHTLLQGTGSVLGNLDIGAARFTPGNSVGSFAVGGNLTLGAGSETVIEVDASGNADHISVGGTATLGGVLKVLPQPGDYTAPGCCSYTVLTAVAVTGSFASVSNDLVFLDTQVSYLPTAVQLDFARNAVAFTTVSLTWNQQQVSAAIDTMEAANPADPLAALMAPLSATQARTAFDGLSGDTLLAAADASAHAAARFTQLLSRRGSRLGLASRGGEPGAALADLDVLRHGGLPVAPRRDDGALRYNGPTSPVEGVWVEATALDMSAKSDSNVGSAGGGLSGQLLALGVDGYWRDALLVGFAAGTLDADLSYDNRNAQGTASATFAGLYGRWDSGAGLQYKAALSLAQQDNELRRTIPLGASAPQARGTQGITTLGLALEAGMALHVASVGLRPHVLLDLQALEQDAYREAGGGSAALEADASSAMLGDFGVGLEVSRPWLTESERWAQVTGSLALLQPFGDTQREQTVRFNGAGTAFTVRGTPDDSAVLALSLGGEVYLTSRLALWGGAEGRVSGAFTELNGVLSMQYRW